MNEDIDIYRSANELVKQHGEDAAIYGYEWKRSEVWQELESREKSG